MNSKYLLTHPFCVICAITRHNENCEIYNDWLASHNIQKKKKQEKKDKEYKKGYEEATNEIREKLEKEYGITLNIKELENK